jgi:TRAP-type C4-dicarboxylate transport system permease small subunit
MLDAVAQVSARLAGVALFVIVALIAYEIVLRNLFQTSSGFSTEYSAYLLVVLVFLALPETQRSGGMIYMEFVYDALPARIRGVANRLRYVIALCYSLVLTYYVADFTASTCSLNQRSLYATQTPLCIPQSFMVIGLVLLSLELLRGTFHAFRRPIADRSDPGSAP